MQLIYRYSHNMYTYRQPADFKQTLNSILYFLLMYGNNLFFFPKLVRFKKKKKIHISLSNHSLTSAWHPYSIVHTGENCSGGNLSLGNSGRTLVSITAENRNLCKKQRHFRISACLMKNWFSFFFFFFGFWFFFPLTCHERWNPSPLLCNS